MIFLIFLIVMMTPGVTTINLDLIWDFQKYMIHGYFLQIKSSRTSLYLEDIPDLLDHPDCPGGDHDTWSHHQSTGLSWCFQKYMIHGYLLQRKPLNWILPKLSKNTWYFDICYKDNYQEYQEDQEDQEDPECPPSTRMFLMTLSATNIHVSYIFGNLRTNPVEWWWHQVSWLPSGQSGWSGRSGMSSKYKDVLDGFICNKYPCIIYFWKPQVKSS